MRRIRMPTEHDLPRGPVRDFVELLFILLNAAHRPTLRQISEAIRDRGDRQGTVSHETIRRMLHGSIPSQWLIVEAVMVALCDLARIDPDERRHSEEWGDYTWRERIESSWNRALDA
jgi:hypothetical protein